MFFVHTITHYIRVFCLLITSSFSSQEFLDLKPRSSTLTLLSRAFSFVRCSFCTPLEGGRETHSNPALGIRISEIHENSSTLLRIIYSPITQVELYMTFFFFFQLTFSRWTSLLPSCLWSQRIFPSLPGSRLTIFLSRCKFSILTTRQPMVEFYLLTFPRFPLRKKEHKSYFGKNRTHDFRTSRCAAYLLDHSGDGRLTVIYGVQERI